MSFSKPPLLSVKVCVSSYLLWLTMEACRFRAFQLYEANTRQSPL